MLSYLSSSSCGSGCFGEGYKTLTDTQCSGCRQQNSLCVVKIGCFFLSIFLLDGFGLEGGGLTGHLVAFGFVEQFVPRLGSGPAGAKRAMRAN